MNQIFEPYLIRFILFFFFFFYFFLFLFFFFFFNDILVYSRSLDEHLEHLKTTPDILRKNQLYAKMSKCRFGCQEVEYLGHIVSKHGVKARPNKIRAMVDWHFQRH
jgi:hypothetical protein